MALTPYIWALWHTKSGKVIIICIIIFLICGVIIKALKWWSIAVFAGFILFCFWIKKIADDDHQRELDRLREEGDRLHAMYEAQQKRKKKQDRDGSIE